MCLKNWLCITEVHHMTDEKVEAQAAEAELEMRLGAVGGVRRLEM
jgi:hypothetical protein